MAVFTLRSRRVVATIPIHDLTVDMPPCFVCLTVSLYVYKAKADTTFVELDKINSLVTRKGNVRDGTATLGFKEEGEVGLVGTR